jgi:hypothetical protein
MRTEKLDLTNRERCTPELILGNQNPTLVCYILVSRGRFSSIINCMEIILTGSPETCRLKTDFDSLENYHDRK